MFLFSYNQLMKIFSFIKHIIKFSHIITKFILFNFNHISLYMFQLIIFFIINYKISENYSYF